MLIFQQSYCNRFKRQTDIIITGYKVTKEFYTIKILHRPKGFIQ